MSIYFFKDIVTFSFIWLANCLISGLPKKDEKKLIISLPIVMVLSSNKFGLSSPK